MSNDVSKPENLTDEEWQYVQDVSQRLNLDPGELAATVSDLKRGEEHPAGGVLTPYQRQASFILDATGERDRDEEEE